MCCMYLYKHPAIDYSNCKAMRLSAMGQQIRSGEQCCFSKEALICALLSALPRPSHTYRFQVFFITLHVARRAGRPMWCKVLKCCSQITNLGWQLGLPQCFNLQSYVHILWRQVHQWHGILQTLSLNVRLYSIYAIRPPIKILTSRADLLSTWQRIHLDC